MSKNYELLQQAEFGLGGTPAATRVGIEAAPKTQESTVNGAMAAAESVAGEESLKLVQRLFLNTGQPSPKAVMFAAIDSGKGCSRLCATAARLLAESVSGSVCLVEANFRGPSLPSVLGVDNHHGLADALRQEGSIKGFAKRAGRDNFWLLSSGAVGNDSLSLLSCDRMKERITELRSEFDYLLIDAPPLNTYADGMILGRLTDGVVLVLEANTTRREAALRVTESLRTTRIPVLGAVLNNRTFPIPEALYRRL
jgi:protein-tyrosine kinase